MEKITRRAAITGFVAIPAAGLAPIISAKAEPLSPVARLRNAVAEIRAAMADLGSDDYMAVIRERKSEVGSVLVFHPATGRTVRQIEIS